MTKEQEAQWLYAKGLELAIKIKGIPDNLQDIPNQWDTSERAVNDFINKYYNEIAMKIARRIIISSKELIPSGLT
jgi:hypothetical protein